MTRSDFDYLVKENLPITIVSPFGEESVLYYNEKSRAHPIKNDLNNLTNEQIRRIIKDKSISLSYQFFSISIFHVHSNRIVFFTQKCDGIKSSLSQIFLNDEPVLILETKFLNLIEILIDEFKKKCRTDMSNLINEFMSYEFN